MGIRENIQYWIVDLTSEHGMKTLMSKHLGVTKQAVSNWCNGVSVPDLETLVKISEIYNVPLIDLLKRKPNTEDNGADDSNVSWHLNNQVDVPLYGSIAAGTPIEMIDRDDSYPIPFEIYAKYPNAFLLKVKGESMNRVLPNGCYALVDPCSDVELNNQPYAICVNGHNATIKRVHKLANGFELVPDSTDPTYKPIIYDYGVPDTDKITVIGRVVYHVLPFDWSY